MQYIKFFVFFGFISLTKTPHIMGLVGRSTFYTKALNSNHPQTQDGPRAKKMGCPRQVAKQLAAKLMKSPVTWIAGTGPPAEEMTQDCRHRR